jgi:TolB protein
MADEVMKMLAGERPVFTSKIAFVSNRDGNDEIYLMDYDGANQTRLTYNKIKDYMPALSPDGTMVVYTSYRRSNPDLVLRSLRGREQVITGDKLLAPSPRRNGWPFARPWKGNAESTSATWKRANPAPELQRPSTRASWSPTGRELAFTSDRTGTGMPQIYLMDAEGSNVRKVSFGGNYHDAPAWSPTGDRIVFVSRVENFFDLYSLNMRTNQISKLTETNARNETPSWSPDGRHILFASNQSGSIQIYSLDYDGANMRRLTDRGENKLPNWTN